MKKILFMTLVAFVLGACSNGEPTDTSEEIPSFLGPDDKADNFFSESAQEYYVRGSAEIVLEEEYRDATEEERFRRVAELIPYKQVQIGFFLNIYLIDKAPDADNRDYGGLKALTKNGSYEGMNIQQVDDLTYTFDFVQEIGGQFDLLRELSRTAGAEPQEDGSHAFDLAVGILSNDEMTQLDHENEWYRRAPWSTFSPDRVDQSRIYYQRLSLLPQERSRDAWIDYNRLFEDGQLTIGTFFGWDYHNEYHRVHAESTYHWLLRQGFESPVDSWSEYATNRGPLTYRINANGRPVDVSITLWWGEPGTSTDPDTDAGGRVLEEEMRLSFRDHDVTIFGGHSGPWYGFALANWRMTSEGDLDDSEIPYLDMPADKYQVVLAEGCDTYALGQAFWANPNKADRQNLDIITTTSFSAAGTNRVITDFLTALVGTNNSGEHTPMRYGALLRSMDSASFWFKTMYGVHGIDNNPQGHPYRNVDRLCGSCTSSADCGGEGNRCVALEGAQVCTYECTTDAGCPGGYECRRTSTQGWLTESYCMPRSYSCDEIPPPTGPTVIINEVMASPPLGLEGDLNGDGVRHFHEDEFIELYNAGTQTIDLAGWSLADDVMVRFTFPFGATIAPGEYVVVFGGGDVERFTGLPDVLIYASSNALSLNNRGDSVFLTDLDGALIDSVSYGPEGGRYQTLNRVSPDSNELTLGQAPTPGAPNR